MRIATWNVNSLRARQGHVIDWLKANPVDAIGLQEIKMQGDQFPLADFEALGYRAAVNGQKTYNGVAILSRHPLEAVAHDIHDFDDPQKRVIAATVGDVRLVNVYVPNGKAVGTDKYAYKLKWLERLRDYLLTELIHHPKLALMGDFNVAPTDADVHDPVMWSGRILCSELERSGFQGLLALGLIDAFCLFPRPEQCYTWWDYRTFAFRRGMGLRIDHILLSPALAEACRSCEIDVTPRQLERPSDHAPVTVNCITQP
jgi:exodeoxyribonuclease III